MNPPPPGSRETQSNNQPVGCPLIRLGHTSPIEESSNVSSNYSRNPSECRHSNHPHFTDRYGMSEQKHDYHCYDNRFTGNCQQPYYKERSFLNESADSSNSENACGSPLLASFSTQPCLDLSSFAFDSNYWDHDNYKSHHDPKYLKSQHTSQPKYFELQSSNEPNYLLDNFANLGKTSPSLDQGYHTLVSPSPGLGTPTLWNDTQIFKLRKLDTKNNSFDRLADDIIVNIFSFLTSLDLSVCARVCRRFEVLAWTPALWRTISLQGENVSGDRAIRGVLRQLCGQGRTGACPNVERVHITDGAKLTDRGLVLLARRCPELNRLQVQASLAITNNALFEIVTRCHNLQHLDISGCIQISSITTNVCPETPTRLQLQYLDLTDCPAVQDSDLRVIMRNCPQLTYLYLRRCIQITDAGLKNIPSFCCGMRELSISDCSYVTDFGLYELAKLGATLRYLSVAKCDQVSDAGLKVIAKRCYKLRYLNVRGCEAVSDDAITVLAKSCTRLRALDIGKCDVSDAGLRVLAESCPNLKKLSLRNCDLVTDKGVQCVAYYCRGLQQLNIQDCQISLEGYRAVKKFCKRCVIEHTNPGFF